MTSDFVCIPIPMSRHTEERLADSQTNRRTEDKSQRSSAAQICYPDEIHDKKLYKRSLLAMHLMDPFPHRSVIQTKFTIRNFTKGHG